MINQYIGVGIGIGQYSVFTGVQMTEWMGYVETGSGAGIGSA